VAQDVEYLLYKWEMKNSELFVGNCTTLVGLSPQTPPDSLTETSKTPLNGSDIGCKKQTFGNIS
jgi:hypothetical protein